MSLLDRCDTHGVQGYYEVCVHVADALANGRRSAMRETLNVVLACDECFDRLGLARFEGSTPWSSWTQEAQRAYDQVHATSDFWCNQCVASARLRWARESGRPDPFRAYERTVTFLQRDLRDRIESGLKEEFAFRESLIRPGTSSLSVRCGALTFPLRIVVYYVVDAQVQDAIQQWIERFLGDAGLPEYHLEFLAFENWIAMEDGGGRQDEEQLLREVWGG